MTWLSKQKKVIFLGEGIINAERVYNTLCNVSLKKCVEFPIAENLIVGSAIGLALKGYRPIVIFQRMDFMLMAADQIINHLALIPRMSGKRIRLPIIIRAIIGSRSPKFDVGCQHNKDLTHVFSKWVTTFELNTKDKDAETVYKHAWELNSPVLIVEDKDLYDKD
jgi:pyruvate/2-oxoglutarate/acetoin dehydrogenase E1 component